MEKYLDGNHGRQKSLFIPLKKEYFEQFERGEKHSEFRRLGKRWNFDTCVTGRRVILSCGYGKQRRLYGEIGKVMQCFAPPDFVRAIYPTGEIIEITIKLDKIQGASK